jgi:DNA polymerase-3 subunit delta'
MRDESQNALLKTLEEPPDYVHLILLTSEPEMLLETVASRCQPVDFAPLPTAAIEASLEGAADPPEIAAAARLSAGDLERARFLLSNPGRQLRTTAFELGKAAGAWASESGKVTGPDSPEDWPSAEAGPVAHPAAGTQLRRLLKLAEAAGEDAEVATREALEEERAAGVKRSARDVNDEAKRVARRRRTEVLDLGLELCAAWFRDLAAVASGAPEVAYNHDRLTQLQSQARGLDPAAPRQAVELVQETRRRLDLNVSEELALEALAVRLGAE